MTRKRIIPILIVVVLAGAVGIWALDWSGSDTPASVRHDMVRMHVPSPGDTIKSPLHVEGTARGGWFFEASFPLVLRHEEGTVVAEHYATAEGEWMTENFVPFSSEIIFSHPPEGRGQLILKRANPSGRPERDDELRIPVYFSGAETMDVQVHFGRRGTVQCEETRRVVTRSRTPVRAAIEHLLAGPTRAEQAQGYFSSIPAGVSIQRFVQRGSRVEVDLSEELEAGAGGSCHALAVRSQIENTVLQFSNVDSVVISIDGRGEGILQP